MSNYSTFANGVSTVADKGVLVVASGGTARSKVYDIVLGSDSTPGDQASEFVVNRCTATGVGGTAITPEPLDPLSQAANSTSTHGAYTTTEPVDTAASELLHICLNQRATFRWVAAPGSELIAIITAASGIFLRTVAATGAYNVNATFLFNE
jgi:hypothetical protein